MSARDDEESSTGDEGSVNLLGGDSPSRKVSDTPQGTGLGGLVTKTTGENNVVNDEGSGAGPSLEEATDTSDGTKRKWPISSTAATDEKESVKKIKTADNGSEEDTSPIVPSLVDTPSHVKWKELYGYVLLRQDSSSAPRSKVAGFDLDQTLLNWTCGGWPSQPQHYELWSRDVITKLREKYDNGHELVIFSNQGGIRSALQGKTATRIKGLINWLGKVVDRPLSAVVSTSTKSGYHKPSRKMWEFMEKELKITADLDKSLYVGDSDGHATDDQNTSYQDLGVDRLFAENVGKELEFQTPDVFFGESDLSKRQEERRLTKLAGYDAPPGFAIKIRAALVGGYLEQKPIMLIMVGVQGSGKSFFCQRLKDWVHLSQDTIANGKPGSRSKVEQAARDAIAAGNSVVVDRMHLTQEQRQYFVEIAQQASVAVHVVVMDTTKTVVERRVKERTNHAVQGESGAQLAVSSLDKLVLPKYDEGFDLISVVRNEDAVETVSRLYNRVTSKDAKEEKLPKSFSLRKCNIKLPSISLGTQKIGKRIASSVISRAIDKCMTSIDTAPTYKNEQEVGSSLTKDCFVTIKVPKRAMQPADVREEALASFEKLKYAHMLLLHWPSDVIEAGTLEAVWKEMEELVHEGYVRCLGVSNFSAAALQELLRVCSSRSDALFPVVNQVERHPLLPQWELLDFCWSRGIVVQAHTSLGQGRDELLQHPELVRLSEQAELSPAQLVLKWNLQQGVPVVTRCTTEQHIDEAVSVFQSPCLASGVMKEIDNIKTGEPTRFVSPPFMYKPGASYSWGDVWPKMKKK